MNSQVPSEEHPQAPDFRENVILPPSLPSLELTAELETYLNTLGVKKGRRSTYAGALHAFGEACRSDPFPRSLTDLFASIGIDAKDSLYGAFNERRAKLAHHDTVRERHEMLGWLGNFGPKFILVEVESPPRCGQMLKAALGASCGLTPAAAPRKEDHHDLVAALWTEMGQASLALPLLTTASNPLALDTVLEASTRMSFDHFAVVDPFYLPQPASGVAVEWTHPAPAELGLGFADSLYSSGAIVGNGPARFATLTINESTQYGAYGPSAGNGYCMQRVLPEGAEATVEKLKQRVQALDSTQLSLEGWQIESLRVSPSARHANARTIHANVMAHGFALFDMEAAQRRVPSVYKKIYRAWDRVVPAPDRRTK